MPRTPELKEKLSQIASKIQSERPLEERQRIARDRDAKMTSEQRSERARKGSATQAAKTLEQKAETARKSAVSKKANKVLKFSIPQPSN